MAGSSLKSIPRYIWAQYSDQQNVVQLERNYPFVAKATLTPYASLDNMLEIKELRDLAWVRMPIRNFYSLDEPISNIFTSTSQVILGGYFNPFFYFARAKDGSFVDDEIIPQLIGLLSGKEKESSFDLRAKPMENWFFYICGRKTQELKMPLPTRDVRIPGYAPS